MAILQAADYPAVRFAIGAHIHEGLLPDTMIGLQQNQGEAELELVALYPTAEAQTGLALQRVKAAAIYLTASRCALAVPEVKSEQQSGRSWSIEHLDYVARSAELRTLALGILGELNPTGGVAEAPDYAVLFGRATGRRGWVRYT